MNESLCLLRSGGASRTTRAKLQALIYDILPWIKVPESGARSVGQSISKEDGLLDAQCCALRGFGPKSKHWFTTSFLGGRCRKAMLRVWVCSCLDGVHAYQHLIIYIIFCIHLVVYD